MGLGAEEAKSGGRVEIKWSPFELRPAPLPEPHGEYIRGHWPGQEVYRLAHEHGLEIHVSRYQPRSTLAPTLRTFAAEPRARAGPTGTPPTAPP